MYYLPSFSMWHHTVVEPQTKTQTITSQAKWGDKQMVSDCCLPEHARLLADLFTRWMVSRLQLWLNEIMHVLTWSPVNPMLKTLLNVSTNIWLFFFLPSPRNNKAFKLSVKLDFQYFPSLLMKFFTLEPKTHFAPCCCRFSPHWRLPSALAVAKLWVLGVLWKEEPLPCLINGRHL